MHRTNLDMLQIIAAGRAELYVQHSGAAPLDDVA